MKNTLIWMHLNNKKIDLTKFKKLDVDFNYKDYEKENNLTIVTIFDECFPTILVRLDNCPKVLYCQGDINLLKEFNTISIVGKRKANFKYKHTLDEVVKLINPRLIVSGMANGWDSYAHKLAFKVEIPTIAVLPGPFDNIYPANNFDLYKKIKQTGLVITEYPQGTKIVPNNFLERNRIVCGLSTITICMEPEENSGTSNSLRTSYDIGNEVIILPTVGNVY